MAGRVDPVATGASSLGESVFGVEAAETGTLIRKRPVGAT